MVNTYLTVSKLMLDYLLNHQMESGAIWDQNLGDIAPDCGYQNTFFSLGCIQMYQQEQENKWVNAARKSLSYFQSIPKEKRGHLEFNNFALVLLLKNIYEHNTPTSPDYQWIETFCKDYVSDIEFRVNPYGGTSNNWLAMRSATHALLFSITGKTKEMRMGCELMKNHILHQQLSDGFFYDYPNNSNADNFSTPFTYHAKICSMLAFFLENIWDRDVLKALIKGLDVLSHFIAPSGQSFYFGRTNNGLFGYAAGIYAYERLASFLKESDLEKSLFYNQCSQKLLHFIKDYQCLDGHIPIAPNDLEGLHCGWDEYMNTTVYNAYAAALLLLISSGEEFNWGKIEQKEKVDTNTKSFYAKSAGLLKVETKDFFACVSTKGQYVDGQSHLFTDIRYSGMNILLLERRTKTLVPPIPLNLESLSNTVDPRFCGLIPYIRLDGKVFGCRQYTDVNVDLSDNDSIVIYGRSIPSYLSSNPYETRGRLYKLSNSIIRHVFHKPYHTFHAEILGGCVIERIMVILPKVFLILTIDVIQIEIKKPNFVNTFSARWCGEGRFEPNAIRVPQDSCELIFETLYPITSTHFESDFLLPSSVGIAHVRNEETEIQNCDKHVLLVNAIYISEECKRLNHRTDLIDTNQLQIQATVPLGELKVQIDLNTKKVLSTLKSPL